jgi:acetate kinase
MRAFPSALQVACFDTAFHRRQPWVATLFALPRRFYDEGVAPRYGFHGLSYDYISRYLREVHPALAKGRVVIAHLGNGASLAPSGTAGHGLDHGLHRVDGMPMGTRTGQLDPGVILYLLSEKGMTPAGIGPCSTRNSGLLGLSGISGDWRRLEAAGDGHAADAMAYFTHRALREIGGLAGIMAGSTRSSSPPRNRRERGGAPPRYRPGPRLARGRDRRAANEAGGKVISTDASALTVLVVPTDEEGVIAHHTRSLVAPGAEEKKMWGK